MKIVTRFRILVGLTATSVVLIAGVTIWKLSEDAIDTRTNEDVIMASRLIDNELTQQGKSLLAQISLLSDQPMLKTLLLHKVDDATVTDWTRDELSKIGVDTLALVNSSGKVLGQASKHHEYITERMPLLSESNSKPVQGVFDLDRRPVLGVCVPVSIGGYSAGKVIVVKNIDSALALNLQRVLGNETLFVSNRRVVAGSIQTGKDLDSLPFQTEILKFDGIRYAALYSALPTTHFAAHLGFIVLKPVDEIVDPYHKFASTFMLVLVLALIAAAILGGEVVARFTAPIEAVIRAAALLRSGVWPESLQVTRTDEIGILQTRFNEMAQSLKENRETILSMADIDSLTSLWNHRKLLSLLEEELHRCHESGSPLSVILLDLDAFGQFNDRFGPGEGDIALNSIAARIRERLPSMAEAARYSGQEFAIVLPGAELEQATTLAYSIQEAIRTAHPSQEITASIGCVAADLVSQTPSSLLLAAEAAVNRAKQKGRDQVCAGSEVQPEEDEAAGTMEQDLATLLSLASTVDERSVRGSLSERVAETAYELAMYLKRPEAEAQSVKRAAQLRDVGQIGIPDSILTKTKGLTEEEFEIMKTHPVLGEAIVRKVHGMHDLLPGIRHHHERWDGKGYPDGQKGKAIPLSARIIAVADIFQTLVVGRTYLPGMPVEEAIAKIESMASRELDPELALALARMERARLRKAA